jgi:hypothetical protein
MRTARNVTAGAGADDGRDRGDGRAGSRARAASRDGLCEVCLAPIERCLVTIVEVRVAIEDPAQAVDAGVVRDLRPVAARAVDGVAAARDDALATIGWVSVAVEAARGAAGDVAHAIGASPGSHVRPGGPLDRAKRAASAAVRLINVEVDLAAREVVFIAILEA